MTPRWPFAHEVVAERARACPETVAVEEGMGRALTYQALDELADVTAQALLSAGIGRGDTVAVWADRSGEGLAHMLGIWKAGAVYLPLDPVAPPARLDAMMADSEARAVLGAPEERARHWSARRVDPQTTPPVDDLPLPRLAREDGAYILFTSGSTGRPKGVLVPHGALAHRIDVLASDMFGVTPTSRVSHYCSWAWDASLFEICLPFAHGATLCIIPEAVRRSGTGLARFLRAAHIDVAFFPPPVLATIPPDGLTALRVVIAGGEALPGSLVATWGTDRRVFNVYGPSETTVWMTTAECRPGEPVTLGHPIPGVEVRIVDGSLARCPHGEVGELLIGGAGLSSGYLGRPEETANRFLPDPEDPTRRVYRTGDRGRILPDGRIEFLGRMDRQVKVRGVRIELGDVEAALADLPGIAAGAVVADKDAPGGTRLLAYVEPDEPPQEATLADPATARRHRDSLRRVLPETVLPSAFILLPRLPRLANEKLDRRALPRPDALASRDAHSLEPPRNPTERAIAEAWATVLGFTHLGRNENVFDLGAHSLAAAHVQLDLERRLTRPVDIVDLFQHPTAAALAAHLSGDHPRAAGATPSATTARDRGQARRAALGRRPRGRNPS